MFTTLERFAQRACAVKIPTMEIKLNRLFVKTFKFYSVEDVT